MEYETIGILAYIGIGVVTSFVMYKWRQKLGLVGIHEFEELILGTVLWPLWILLLGPETLIESEKRFITDVEERFKKLDHEHGAEKR